MRAGLTVAAIGAVLVLTVLAFPPIDESTRCLALGVFALGELFIALGAGLLIRFYLAPPATPEEEAE